MASQRPVDLNKEEDRENPYVHMVDDDPFMTFKYPKYDTGRFHKLVDWKQPRTIIRVQTSSDGRFLYGHLKEKFEFRRGEKNIELPAGSPVFAKLVTRFNRVKLQVTTEDSLTKLKEGLYVNYYPVSLWAGLLGRRNARVERLEALKEMVYEGVNHKHFDLKARIQAWVDKYVSNQE
jgi:hypothetical protein